MEISDVPLISLDPSDLAERLRFIPGRAGFPSLDELTGLARGLIAPRAITEVAYIGAKGEGTVEVGGVVLPQPGPSREPRGGQQGLSLHHHGRPRPRA
ncbi:MAG: hypothetical protein MZU79_07155 [Anaerotruncus sp.]|nr:hypothetical protein [Anaerotruncus sp.]